MTLSEILGATTARAAAMVPESAGYLVLALCEATGHLPIRVDPAAVTLSPEGVVAVDRQGEVLSGVEAARGLRELLGRLLAVTTGGAAGLHAVARPRAPGAPEFVTEISYVAPRATRVTVYDGTSGPICGSTTRPS